MSHADLGKSLAELDTPALLVDLGALDRNIATMAAAARTKRAGSRSVASRAPRRASSSPNRRTPS